MWIISLLFQGIFLCLDSSSQDVLSVRSRWNVNSVKYVLYEARHERRGINQGVPVTGHHTSIPRKNRKVRFASKRVISCKICAQTMFLAGILAIFRIKMAYVAARVHRWRYIFVPTLCWCDGWPDYGDFLADVDLQVSPMRSPHVGVVQMLLKMPQNRVWGRRTEKNGSFFGRFLGGWPAWGSILGV